MSRRAPPQREGVIAWTEADDAALREMWEAGRVASEIGLAMGRSRNSVIGRAHRMLLPARPSPIGQRPPGAAPKPKKRGRPKRADLQRAARIAARRAAAPVNPIPAAPPAFAGDPAPVRSTGFLDVSSLDLPRPVTPAGGSSAGCCRWPLWGHKERPTHRYCGDPVSHRRDGAPRAYCAAHAAVAFADKVEADPGHTITRSTFAWGGVRA